MFFLPLCLLVGCASHSRTAKAPLAAPTGKVVAEGPAPLPVTFVQTQYEVGGYRDPSDAAVWHEPHAILRQTVVPGTTPPSNPGSGPLTAYVPASYAPLPPSAELTAELDTQRQITGDLRAVKTKMALLQGEAQEQYGKLVAQTTETDRLRQQLVAEQARLKAKEGAASPPPNPPGAEW